jgi:hypothetical protein
MPLLHRPGLTHRLPARIGPLLLAPALLAALILTACEDEADRGGGEVDVTLQEWSITTDRETVPAGDVSFRVRNEGPDHRHQMAIIRTDLPVDDLPTRTDGSVDEGAAGVSVVNRIRTFDTGRTTGGTFRLGPGQYALVCNISENIGGERVSHYDRGMRIALTVE